VAQLLSRLKLGPVDQVFLAAASELDLIGLADFLYSADLPNVDWHVQFHFDFGDSEDQQVEIRRRLLDAREKLQQHRVFMYTTTPELAKIYNTLDVGRFHPLPYPLHENFLRPPVHRDDQWPRRILCAGDTRPEKGLHHLAPITDQLLDLLRDGQIQFVVQVDRANAEHWQSVAERLPPGSFQLVPHPLSTADYCELVRGSHIGLLLYDPASYVHRRAGILCEFLVSGVPVVVPDHCWLAGQLTSPVGLAAEGTDDFAQKLRNLVQNYDRFAEVAKSFAGPYSVEFHAARTLEVLLDTATGQTPSFAASLPSCGRHEVH
jgi:glycosyltransferase involved in cell wall biosynthesis